MVDAWHGLAVQHLNLLPRYVMWNHHLYESLQERSLPSSSSLLGLGHRYDTYTQPTECSNLETPVRDWLAIRLVEAGGSENPVIVLGRERGWHTAVLYVQRQEQQWRYLVPVAMPEGLYLVLPTASSLLRYQHTGPSHLQTEFSHQFWMLLHFLPVNSFSYFREPVNYSGLQPRALTGLGTASEFSVSQFWANNIAQCCILLDHYYTELRQ